MGVYDSALFFAELLLSYELFCARVLSENTTKQRLKKVRTTS
jgi:hypothetical protein